MLQIRPTCEHCNKPLPNDSAEAMICSFECTFCAECVQTILENVCPNCGGGFEKRPVRPTNCVTENCIENYPAGSNVKHRLVDMKKFQKLLLVFKNTEPEKR